VTPDRPPTNAIAQDVQLIAFYLPQFHPIPENDAWWGTGFTEWTNVRRARPNFVGHEQPRIPTELGYYDLRSDVTRAAQAALAQRYGIHGFCYYHYWFDGKRLLEQPLDAVLRSGAPDFPFCICWANENWSRRWDGGNNELLMRQTYSSENDRRFITELLPVLSDSRYIKVRGRPLLILYRASLLPEPRRTADTFRAAVRTAGLGELLLCCVDHPGTPSPAALGVDAAIEFPPHGMEAMPLTDHVERINPEFSGEVWDYVSAARFALERPLPSHKLFRGVMVGWDNTPRVQNNGQIFVNNHPDNYRRWLSGIVDRLRHTNPTDDRIVFVNAWNEWGEGCYLEPDRQFGRGYLEATLAALQPRPAGS
jgi:lipopolysaccharide biosynthesis protein